MACDMDRGGPGSCPSESQQTTSCLILLCDSEQNAGQMNDPREDTAVVECSWDCGIAFLVRGGKKEL